ncbi:TPA: hypothetical protein ACHU7R_000818 [Streptococcus suis]
MEYQLNYAKTTEFKGMFKEYIKDMQHLKNMIEWDTRPEKIAEFKKETKDKLLRAYNAYKFQKMTEARSQMEVIEKQFKNTRVTYTDPQAEILRRQDFDMEFSMLDRDDIVEMLNDEQRDFSDYELKKIQITYKGDYKIENLLNKLMTHNENLYQEDPEYQEWRQEYLFLKQTQGFDLITVYIPSNTAPEGYTILNIDGVLDKNIFPWDIEEHIAHITLVLNAIPSLPKKDKIKQPAKKMEFEEFDDRIYRVSPDYDVAIRFKYLKERFDDTTTDRWDFSRDDYDAYRHLQFLEKRHDLKLQNDEEYRKQYYAVETAIKNELEQKKVNFDE